MWSSPARRGYDDRMTLVSRVAGAACVGCVMLVVSVAGLACGSFSESPPDPAGTADGGVVIADGQAPDVVPPGADGATSCAASRFCACQMGAAFCSDFDGPTLFEEWDAKQVAGGMLAAVPSQRSAPNALRVQTPPTDVAGVPTASATLTRHIEGNVAKMTLSIDVSAQNACAHDIEAAVYVELLGLDRPDGAGPGAGKLALLATKSGAKLLVKDGSESYVDLLPPPDTKPWSTLAIVLANGQAQVIVDDRKAADPVEFLLTSTKLDLVIGVTAGPGSDACEATYDNVVVRFAP